MSEGGLRAVFLADRAMFLRLLVARLGNVDEAEDALQDLWLKLEGVTGGPIADPTAYLYRMANNIAVDRRRRAVRRSDRDTGWMETRPTAEEHPDAERAMIARERLARVEATLAKLPERVATAFRLYRFEELSQKAIAERMGISVSGVEKLLHRAYLRVHAHRASFGEDGDRAWRLVREEDHRDGR
ncbi:sigma-70 family RNA polymerase sigma factor [Sphingomonas sp. ZT3P38]|uniref:RNA polymerase sigma factor n=1 Tax=Parasphingomonas zepuensis TaxID=3096161 RepID=UPI002FC70ADD